jgi:FtsP/CotA-like multicopper oxidase with cupredoxin domain
LTENLDDLQTIIGEDLLKLPLENFEVESNKKYLFRIIGANKAFALQISFEGHTFKVVASDGNQIEPIENVETLIVNR